MRPSPSCPPPVGSNKAAHPAVALLDAIQAGGFTATQFRILITIHLENLSTPSAIARKLGLTPSGVSEAMGRLLARKLVTRERDPANDSLVNYQLTKSTQEKVTAILSAGRPDDQA